MQLGQLLGAVFDDQAIEHGLHDALLVRRQAGDRFKQQCQPLALRSALARIEHREAIDRAEAGGADRAGCGRYGAAGAGDRLLPRELEAESGGAGVPGAARPCASGPHRSLLARLPRSLRRALRGCAWTNWRRFSQSIATRSHAYTAAYALRAHAQSSG